MSNGSAELSVIVANMYSYLNTNCENEGLYRVPGSGPQVKHWQRRFDQELDIDLLDHLVIGHDAYVSLRDRGVSFDRPGPRAA